MRGGYCGKCDAYLSECFHGAEPDGWMGGEEYTLPKPKRVWRRYDPDRGPHYLPVVGSSQDEDGRHYFTAGVQGRRFQVSCIEKHYDYWEARACAKNLRDTLPLETPEPKVLSPLARFVLEMNMNGISLQDGWGYGRGYAYDQWHEDAEKDQMYGSLDR